MGTNKETYHKTLPLEHTVLNKIYPSNPSHSTSENPEEEDPQRTGRGMELKKLEQGLLNQMSKANMNSAIDAAQGLHG